MKDYSPPVLSVCLVIIGALSLILSFVALVILPTEESREKAGVIVQAVEGGLIALSMGYALHYLAKASHSAQRTAQATERLTYTRKP
jgi:hypothetical protein